MNIYITQAVAQLIEYLNSIIGTEEEFMADEIRIARSTNSFGDETWVVIPFKEQKAFKYAWYVNGSNIVADGY